jgi:hypothetical protein
MPFLYQALVGVFLLPSSLPFILPRPKPFNTLLHAGGEGGEKEWSKVSLISSRRAGGALVEEIICRASRHSLASITLLIVLYLPTLTPTQPSPSPTPLPIPLPHTITLPFPLPHTITRPSQSQQPPRQVPARPIFSVPVS